MRVTNSMLITNGIYNINNNTSRLDKAQEQESTQSKIQLPSDDPAVATQAVKYRNYVSTTEQYQKNVGDATSWMSVTEGALSDLNDVMQRVRELSVQAANTGILSDSELSGIKQEVSQLKQTAIQTLNSTYAGRYIFAGYETDQPPFQEKTITVGSSTVDRVTYKGKYMDLNGAVSTDINSTAYATAYKTELDAGKSYVDDGTKQEMKYNVGFGSQITVNVEGQDVVGTDSANNLFATFDKLLIGLDGKNSYQSISSGTATGSTDLSSLSYPYTVNSTNDNLNLKVDGAPMPTEITIPASASGTYSSASALVTAINKGIEASALKGKVSASLNSSNQLVFSSASTSTSSAVIVTDGTTHTGALAAYVGTATPLSGGMAKTSSFSLSGVLGDIDNDLSRISAITSSLGARENTASIATSRLADDNTVYTKLMANNECVDIAEATTNVSTAKAVYEASLSATAKSINKTLLDYIG